MDEETITEFAQVTSTWDAFEASYVNTRVKSSTNEQLASAIAALTARVEALENA